MQRITDTYLNNYKGGFTSGFSRKLVGYAVLPCGGIGSRNAFYELTIFDDCHLLRSRCNHDAVRIPGVPQQR